MQTQARPRHALQDTSNMVVPVQCTKIYTAHGLSQNQKVRPGWIFCSSSSDNVSSCCGRATTPFSSASTIPASFEHIHYKVWVAADMIIRSNQLLTPSLHVYWYNLILWLILGNFTCILLPELVLQTLGMHTEDQCCSSPHPEYHVERR